MRRPLKAIVLMFVVALIAAACSSSTDDTTTTTAGDTGQDTTTTTAGDTGQDTTTTTVAPTDDFVGTVSEASCDDASNTSNFQKIEAVDRLTVRMELCDPDVAFSAKVAFSAFGIHPSEYLESTGGTGDLLDMPIGTGPYSLNTWDKGNQIVMDRYDGYWGPAATTSTLVFRWSSEAAQRFVELQAGTVDGIDNPGRDDFAAIVQATDLKLNERAGTNIFYLGLNRDMPQFEDVRVRQAVAMALNRQRIVDNFYPPGSIVAGQFMPVPIFGFTPQPLWYEQDIDAAKALLADAGVPDGFEVTLNYRDVVRSYLPTPSTVGQDIQDQLADIGITVNIEVMESGAFLDASDAGELTMYMLGWGADYPDATNFLDFHFGRTASDQFGAGFPNLWDVLDEAATTADPATRLTLYENATQIIKDEVPMVPVAHGGSGVGYRGDVGGSHASPLGNEYFAVMDPGGRDTFVWMQNAEPISLYCADETDGETLRACEQLTEQLLSYAIGGTAVQAGLAETWESDDSGTVWTFHLRDGVTFHDGSSLDANDVVASYDVQWDSQSPLHTGRDGNFTYFDALFGFKNVAEG